MGFVLPAGLGFRQLAVIAGGTARQAFQRLGRGLAAHFNDEFLFQAAQVGVDLAGYPPVLGEYLQAAGTALQRRHAGLPGKMPVQCAHAFAVGFAEVAHVHAGAGGFAVHAGRLVQQQGYRFQRFGTGTRQQFDALLLDLELRLLDHHAIDRDPAALDIQLGLAAGAAKLLDKAFGQADGFGHDGNSQRQGKTCIVPARAAEGLGICVIYAVLRRRMCSSG
ncbi:hypothetical protein D3C81_1157240 [compost metagenome]